jgi:hypothetical protein
MFLQLNPKDFPLLGPFVDEPSRHPDFVNCDDPRLEGENHAAGLPVYVPSLVELVHRLGGLDNIPIDFTGDDFVSVTLLPDGAHETDARVFVGRFEHKGGTVLDISHWHPNHEMSLLGAHFIVPEKWATGEWEVGYVSNQDIFALTDGVRLEVARLCNRAVGMLLAHPHHALLRRSLTADPLKASRILRPGRD